VYSGATWIFLIWDCSRFVYDNSYTFYENSVFRWALLLRWLN